MIGNLDLRTEMKLILFVIGIFLISLSHAASADSQNAGDSNDLLSTVSHPPSIGNDYLHPYDGGVTINGQSFDVKKYSTILQQQILKIGKPAIFSFKVYDERGPDTISHVGMYFHFKGDPSVVNANTWISWDKNKGLSVHDPDNLFSKTTVDTKINNNLLDITFTFTPQKVMPDSSLIMRMWDYEGVSGDVRVLGLFIIVDPNSQPQVKTIPSDRYHDYLDLEKTLGKDGYDVPALLHKLHSLPDLYSSLDIYWVYDKGAEKLTLVVSDKSENLLGTFSANLTNMQQPTVKDENHFNYSNDRLYRSDLNQENNAMQQEEEKAIKLLESMGMIRHNNFENMK
jgi:hypothetical protein